MGHFLSFAQKPGGKISLSHMKKKHSDNSLLAYLKINQEKVAMFKNSY